MTEVYDLYRSLAVVKDTETLNFHNITIRVLHGYTSGKAFVINTGGGGGGELKILIGFKKWGFKIGSGNLKCVKTVYNGECSKRFEIKSRQYIR